MIRLPVKEPVVWVQLVYKLLALDQASKTYKVYLLTFPNGKKYCGYTSRELKKRWNNGNGYEKCPLVYKAIQKYGWNNVQKDLLFEFNTSEEGLNKEKEIIALYDLTNPNKGYNLHEGGKPVGSAPFLTEEGRKKLSEKSKARWQNPEYRAKMIEKAKQRHPTKECIEKGVAAARLVHLGKTPNNARPVYQLNKDTEEIIKDYPSASHAAKELCGDVTGCTNILQVCKGRRKTAYNYKWRFKENV